MGGLHTYTVAVDWTGADEAGTRSYTAYSRDHEVRVEGKPALLATSDRKVAADVSRYRAEELFVRAVSPAQMLWFLRSVAAQGCIISGYTAVPKATERNMGANSAQFISTLLR